LTGTLAPLTSTVVTVIDSRDPQVRVRLVSGDSPSRAAAPV
jgi:hypothetical protein